MKRVLLIGGYGGFGARLARRLSDGGTHILVAGRSLAKAQNFAAALPNARGIVVDRNSDIAPTLAEHKPDLVIDAAGPFQGSSYAVPQTCIAARIAYVDLADARDFVVDFADLDAAAKAMGVALISGASSVPALSGAVVRTLAYGLNHVDAVDMAINASNRASAGESVARAALSYAGRPVWLWRGKRWQAKPGWSALQRVRFQAPDGTELKYRWLALADIPDHALMPDQLPGKPAVTFRAGTELCFQMTGLWLASFLVRWRLLHSLAHFAPQILPFIRATKNWGGDRSAIHVIMKGRRDGAPVERRWTLIAEQGDGPEIPTLAAELVARKLLAGTVDAGARDASATLSLDEFQPLFDSLALHHGISESPLPLPVYVRAMGEGYDRLPGAVRAMHDIIADGGAEGQGTVESGPNPLARLIGAVMRFPPSGTYPLHVDFAEQGGKERWTRHFGAHRFSSELSLDGNGVIERFGPMRFSFALPSDDTGLGMKLRNWTIFGLPMPLALAPRIEAREGEDEQGRFRFSVAVALPLIGRVVGYQGWLIKI